MFICTNWLYLQWIDPLSIHEVTKRDSMYTNRPYPWTGNGYIMDWVAFIASFKAAHMSLSQFREMARCICAHLCI